MNFWVVVPCSLVVGNKTSTLKMEAAWPA